MGLIPVVCHYKDGTIVKGKTSNFSPQKEKFHVLVEPLHKSSSEPESRQIKLEDLKGVFFVKDFEGNPKYQERKEFIVEEPHSVKVAVKFLDGEIMLGTTAGYMHGRKAFLLTPADPGCNNRKVCVVTSFVERVFKGHSLEELLQNMDK